MVKCGSCRWGKPIDAETRLRLSQENKEILNVLLRRGFGIEEFVYCSRLGFIESVFAEKECEEWEHG